MDELGISEKTTVIVTSDNGGRSTLYGPGDATSNLPLRAGKGWLYEGGIRVPLIVRTPGFNNSGIQIDTPVVSTDIFPTLLDLSGQDLQPLHHQDGVSLVPLINGEEIDRGALFFYYPHYHGSASLPTAAIREGDWKLVKFFETEVVELYNLEEDIGESVDLSERYPLKTTRMHSKLLMWLKSTGAALTSKNNLYVEGHEEMNFEH